MQPRLQFLLFLRPRQHEPTTDLASSRLALITSSALSRFWQDNGLYTGLHQQRVAELVAIDRAELALQYQDHSTMTSNGKNLRPVLAIEDPCRPQRWPLHLNDSGERVYVASAGGATTRLSPSRGVSDF